MLKKLDIIIDNLGILDNIENGELVAIKIHPGEAGNPNYLRPMYVRHIAEEVRKKGGKPFITDTTTYYRNRRHNGADALVTAGKHGFIWTDIPYIIADGLKGENAIDVQTKGTIDQAEMAGAIHQADAMITLSHVKGHGVASFGGGIKNLGMGCVSKRTKLKIHRTVEMHLDEEKCQKCGSCIEVCPVDAIFMGKNGFPDYDKGCMRCGICGSRCPEDAVSFSGWENVSKGLASAAKAVTSTFEPDKLAFINFAIDISQFCDCIATPGKRVSDNIGMFGAVSPVSADAAVLSRAGNIFKESSGIDPWIQIDEALAIGMTGSRDPELEEV